MAPSHKEPGIYHATAIAHAGQGVMILGPAGAGKSALALQMITRGAALVADDRVALSRHGSTLTLGPPPEAEAEALRGVIEVRGLGLLSLAQHCAAAPLSFVIRLCSDAPRLPLQRRFSHAGLSVAEYQSARTSQLADALWLMLTQKASLLPD